MHVVANNRLNITELQHVCDDNVYDANTQQKCIHRKDQCFIRESEKYSLPTLS